jgi:hypothetical protein
VKRIPAVVAAVLLHFSLGCADVSRKTTIQMQPALEGQQASDLSKEWFALLASPAVSTPNCIQNSLIFGLRPGTSGPNQGSNLSDWTTRRLSGRTPLDTAATANILSTVFPIVEIVKNFAGDATIGAAGFLHQPTDFSQPNNCRGIIPSDSDLFPVSAELTIGTQEEATLSLRVGPKADLVPISSIPNTSGDPNALYGMSAAQLSSPNSNQDFDRWAIAIVPNSADYALTWRIRHEVTTNMDGIVSTNFPQILTVTEMSGLTTAPPYIQWNRILSPGIENSLFVLGCSVADAACINPVKKIQILDQIPGNICRNPIGIRVTLIQFDPATNRYVPKAYPAAATSATTGAGTNTVCGMDP